MMHKLLFGILLLGISSISNAQKRNTVDILYILKNSQDTLSAKAFVSVNLFNKNFIDPLSFDKNILIENGKGRTKIKEKDIQWMSFTDFENKKRVFKYIPEIDQKDELFEEMSNGKIKWYIQYVRNLYDGSAIDRNFFIKNNETPVFCPSPDMCKKKIADLLSDNKELLEQWEQTKPKISKNLLPIIEKYNSAN